MVRKLEHLEKNGTAKELTFNPDYLRFVPEHGVDRVAVVRYGVPNPPLPGPQL